MESSLVEIGLAVALGTSATLFAELWLRRHDARKHRDSLVEDVQREVRVAVEISSERLAAADSVDALLAPPLPTEAWRALVASGLSGQIPAGDRFLIQEMYRAIEAANYRASTLPALLHISVVAPTIEGRASYADAAEHLAEQPFVQVLAAAKAMGARFPSVQIPRGAP